MLSRVSLMAHFSYLKDSRNHSLTAASDWIMYRSSHIVTLYCGTGNARILTTTVLSFADFTIIGSPPDLNVENLELLIGYLKSPSESWFYLLTTELEVDPCEDIVVQYSQASGEEHLLFR